MVLVVSLWHFTTEAKVWFWTSVYSICGTYIFPCKCHSTSAVYSFIDSVICCLCC